MNGKNGLNPAAGQRGSVLILVLWVLMMVGVLSGEYLAHNRHNASLAVNAAADLRRSLAVESVLQLLAVDSLAIPGFKNIGKDWVHLAPAGIEVSIRLSKEDGRLNVNTAGDDAVRERIRAILGDEPGDEPGYKDDRRQEADQLADAVLDWRDKDGLTRLQGAEAGYYKDQEMDYAPADGPFKVLSELLLVRGMTPEIFWGDPRSSDSAVEDLEADETLTDQSGASQAANALPQSVAEGFTIYGKDVSRLEILMPQKGRGYYVEILFLKKKNNRRQVIERCRAFCMPPEESYVEDR